MVVGVEGKELLGLGCCCGEGAEVGVEVCCCVAKGPGGVGDLLAVFVEYRDTYCGLEVVGSVPI